MQSALRRDGAVPLENAAHARIRFEHGGGRLVIRTGTDPSLLVDGDFGEYAEMEVRRDGEQADIVIRPVGTTWRQLIDPTYWRGSRLPLDWDVQLNPNIPLTLDFATGASKSILDLSGMLATEVVLNTGMSDTELIVPAAAGLCRVQVHSGLADVTIRIPPSVSASIVSNLGLASLSVDRARFQPIGSGFESPDFATATNRVRIQVDGGLESVRIV